jgi:hypothetical protein
VRTVVRFDGQSGYPEDLGDISCRDGALVVRISESAFLRGGGTACLGSGAPVNSAQWQVITLQG